MAAVAQKPVREWVAAAGSLSVCSAGGTTGMKLLGENRIEPGPAKGYAWAVGDRHRATELRREDIVTGLEKMNAYLAGQGVRGEICIYGGDCMCLAFKARISPKDIDAVFEPAAMVRKEAFEVAHEMGWAWNWLNDDVKGFLSPSDPEERTFLPLPELTHLRVYVPTPAYLLAMKCLAARPGDEENPSHDLEDALWLARHLGIRDKAALLDVLRRHFPERPLPDRTGFFLRELLASLDVPAS